MVCHGKQPNVFRAPWIWCCSLRSDWFGISSISQGANGVRQNSKDLSSYQTLIEARKLPIFKGYESMHEDHLRAELIMRLMCDLCLKFGAISATWQMTFREYFNALIQQLEELFSDGLIVWSDQSVTVTGRRRLFVRNLAMCFNADLEAVDLRHYSETI